MIITRTPFRITLGGGGTDLPSYYSKYGGFIFAAGINKYMYISVNRPIVDDLVRVKYSKSEIVSHREELQHDIAREAMRMMNIEKGIEIVSMADVPAGTGLGSSSCYAVGLLNALHTMKREFVDLQTLAEEACELEINRLGKPIGKQDQYMAAFGGLTVLDIDKDGTVKVRKARVSDTTIDDLNRNLLMFYTNTSRSADAILYEQSKSVKEGKQNVVESMHYIKEIGYKILEAVESGNITEVGILFDKHWAYKKKISSKMSNPYFDYIYDTAKKAGALGGKITGAGGGGFFVFYVEEKHSKFKEEMKRLGLREMRYRFDFEGTKVLVNFMDGVL
ncbi:D-glycero-alpha-D-manno-heptose-7-phosphate kinase [Candidatus Kryptonium thompsonii]|uniref:D-glycero-alpha-D-manno-heptose-7-phosphate kinase n=1 Tax=Candidatus Kryptonium thompsonii TaxID=1633631 RepID=A0A0N7MR82_9BACT|nr:galactokinase [Candidatus Kryptonium thompsoni]CUS76662.1 D-glycero-alpha-D-manno-heptose-7-phosphate kinase [Candidatus Kryptonium thompsoni]CUS77775.1 D-glycero-alpha-D-manno-heptose-7-phosphate kinase [Candidatus Kryptonium thompsoni]CUS83915.1 D-glycero-alpha-D-manno-heptose-7-phosphate kinase [Candidatus Kryptonium thompsoni]CUS84102.1 D-glycero-alpha-D-manno-heptose-7-phosphate kinase [Candidatus Kryptonium thompsoni]CUS84469.1 D-glycero-alpha-D-manno-heptose-7-phosphate kinase [Candi